MKSLKFITPLFLFILLFTHCANDDLPEEAVEIRLSNVSEFDYKNITVNSTSFEDLEAGKTSTYKTFDLAYRYGFVELEIDGTTYTIQPIDYVGETPLEKGKYTYQIDANDSMEQYGKLILIFVED
ncbi:hypothetical protein [Hyunsoonleella rubra]|uniref:DUF4377 domain-containing protein n=1 Tax=Hyunsoonleella rubra TaxID=1737062 RepID=A0ABW5T7U5_9FLAO